MKTVLHVSASPNGEASTSRATGAALIERMRQRETLRVVERDLARRPPPLVAGAHCTEICTVWNTLPHRSTSSTRYCLNCSREPPARPSPCSPRY
ncbi:NAD(P)H-dependent oxidoreductase [Cupriavidus gilardii]|uniref:NAD(P)H-dependent oxidoreductase n=1 Tax=Cupriavidus gilardii TaxID=82541 RepID=UPI0021FE9632